MPKKTVLSLFSGCGGFDLGFEGEFSVPVACLDVTTCFRWSVAVDNRAMATLPGTGFELVFANDINPKAKIAWTRYFSRHGYDGALFRSENLFDLLERHRIGRFSFPDRVDVLTGGFSCQVFSLAGKRLGFDSHRAMTASSTRRPAASIGGLSINEC